VILIVKSLDIIHCDVGIVGGGISGLYMAYELLKDNSNTKVCIFEKDDTVGGRIRDHRFKEAPDIDVGRPGVALKSLVLTSDMPQ